MWHHRGVNGITLCVSSDPKSPQTPEIDLDALADGLNESQTEAFRHTHGALLVVAGAGSGKTTVLVRRIARLLAEGVPAEKIFVATFTRRAAEEMRERLTLMVGAERLEGIWLGTFHGHCNRILKKEWAEKHGKEGRYELADEYWQKRVSRAILAKGDEGAKLPSPPFAQNMKLDPKMALLAIGAAKNAGWSHEGGADALRRLYPDWDEPVCEHVAKFWRCYEQAKEKKFDVTSKVPARRLDFDDLLVEAYLLLRDDDKLRRAYQEKWDYLLVDETQDTSALQWELACLFARRCGNLFVVGDVGQSVYGFRGCDPKQTVMAFLKSFPKGEILRLPDNYRSSDTIVTVANELIAHADLDDRYRLLMNARRPAGTTPELSQHTDAETEAAHVVVRLQTLLGETGLRLSDFALLYRANAYSRAFEDALIAVGIPYQITGGTSFYNRREVRDLLAYLQLSVDPHCAAGDEAAKRVLNIGSGKWEKPTRFLGAAFVAQVEELAAKLGCSFYEALRRGAFKTMQDVAIRDFRRQIQDIHDAGETATARLLAARRSGYDDYIIGDEGEDDGNGEGSSRLDNLDELIQASARFFTPEAMLTFITGQIRKSEKLSRSNDEDGTKKKTEARDAVHLMTIHRAKGLEWPAVFVVGFALNMLPHWRSLRYADGELLPDSMEEERRLAYVAVTRARDRLHLSWPLFHNGKALGASPFLDEMPTLAPILDAARIRSDVEITDDAYDALDTLADEMQAFHEETDDD